MIEASTQQAVKLYLMSKNELVAPDLTNFNAAEHATRGKHGRPVRVAPEKVILCASLANFEPPDIMVIV